MDELKTVRYSSDLSTLIACGCAKSPGTECEASIGCANTGHGEQHMCPM